MEEDVPGHPDLGVELSGWKDRWDEAVSDPNATHTELSASECSPPGNGALVA